MATRVRILLVDDDIVLLKLLSMRLRAAGYDVETVINGQEALSRMELFRPNLVLTDLRMDGVDGMELFNEIHMRYPMIPVFIMTAHGTIPDAVDAIQRGVFGYLTKPFDSHTLLKSVREALRITVADSGNSTVNELKDQWCKEIVTRSPIMESLLQQARLVAESDVSVFIHGESGTGKELLASAIHKGGYRQNKPFVAVNCTAIPESLLESELFGYVKGSFTGATRNHEGLFQAADTGTIFLDEIGDMSPSFQAKLLRVLQEKEIKPIGSNQPVPVDVRVISATNRNLEVEVEEGNFRKDLYYRLNVVGLELPSLEQRREDIPLLTAHFLRSISIRTRRDEKSLSPESMELLVGATWPGNVRQLQNVIEQTVALSMTNVIPVDLVQRAIRSAPSASIPSLVDKRNQLEREYIAQLLRMTLGNVSHAARLAQRNRSEFYKLMHRHGLNPQDFRVSS